MLHGESAPTPALGLGQADTTAGDWHIVESIGDAAGDAHHELALVVRDVRRMGAVARLVVEVLGVSAPVAKEILCTSPTVLTSKVSIDTALAFYRRFAALDTEVIISDTSEAVFDVFLGDGAPAELRRAVQVLRGLGVDLVDGLESSEQPLLAAGLTKAESDRAWAGLARTDLPVRVINRDFERFGVRLEEAPASPEMIEFLVTSVGMPERAAYKVARKLVRRSPVILHPAVSFARMRSTLAAIHRLGGEATVHLLPCQDFALDLGDLGDLEASSVALQILAGLEPEEALAALRVSHRVEGPLTPPQARWLQWELGRAGTESRLVLR